MKFRLGLNFAVRAGILSQNLLPGDEARMRENAMYNYRNWLKIVLVSAFVLFTNYGFLDRIALLVAQGRPGTIAGFLLVWVLALAAILVAAFQPRWFWRMGWALILAATTAGGVGYFAISGSDFTVFDFASLWNARHGPDDELFWTVTPERFLLAPEQTSKRSVWVGLAG